MQNKIALVTGATRGIGRAIAAVSYTHLANRFAQSRLISRVAG